MKLGTHVWVIADGYIPPHSTGPEPAMTSHDSVCILNANDEDALVQLFLYFTDREPTGPTRSTCRARRACHSAVQRPDGSRADADRRRLLLLSSTATNRSSYNTPGSTRANRQRPNVDHRLPRSLRTCVRLRWRPAATPSWCRNNGKPHPRVEHPSVLNSLTRGTECLQRTCYRPGRSVSPRQRGPLALAWDDPR